MCLMKLVIKSLWIRFKENVDLVIFEMDNLSFYKLVKSILFLFLRFVWKSIVNEVLIELF